MPTTLKALLTETPAEDGNALFATAAALGEAIVTQKSNDYTNARSVGTLIGFVFRGKRSCPTTLRDEILKATRTRLSKQPKRIQDDWVQRLGRAIDSLNAEVSKAQEARSEPDEEQFEGLLKAARSASEHFIVTATPAEMEADTLRPAAALNKILVELLGLYPLLDSEAPTRYRFLLPSEVQARDFWRNLKMKVETLHSPKEVSKEVSERLGYLDERGALEVYVVPTFICGCPIVVFNPFARFQKTTAFTFGYHDNNVIDCVQWHDTSIDEWKRHFHSAFQRKETKAEATHEDNDTWNAFYGYRYRYKQSQQS